MSVFGVDRLGDCSRAPSDLAVEWNRCVAGVTLPCVCTATLSTDQQM